MSVFIVIREVLGTPAILVGLMTLLGLLLQKKSVDQVVKGTVITIVGFVLLSAGSDFLQNGALKDFGVLFNTVFRIQGVIPNMEAIAALGIAEYAAEVSIVMFFGMIANIIMARFGPFPYIFLTGHHTLYMACLLTVVLSGNGMEQWQTVVSGSLMLGLFMALMPSLAQKMMQKVTGDDRIALGHFSTFSYLAAAKAAYFVTVKNRKEPQDGQKISLLRTTEDIRFPSKLSFMRDSIVGIFIVMTGMFLVLAALASTRTDLSALDISYQSGGYQHWVIYAFMQGARFSASIYMILAGVRLVVAEIVPAFKGIAKKMVPHAKPAVDCPVLFSYAPNAVMIGFLMSFLGGIGVMLVLMGFNMWYGRQSVPVIVPGVVAHFFCGGSAGVFANAEGGVKGCVIASFIHGILLSILALSVVPVLGTLNLSGTAFSDADFCIAGVLFGRFVSVFSGIGILTICILVFAAPILWMQMKRFIRR